MSATAVDALRIADMRTAIRTAHERKRAEILAVLYFAATPYDSSRKVHP